MPTAFLFLTGQLGAAFGSVSSGYSVESMRNSTLPDWLMWFFGLNESVWFVFGEKVEKSIKYYTDFIVSK